MNDNDAYNHFINHGMKEQRLYKTNQLPYIEDKYHRYVPSELRNIFNIF